MRSARLGSDKHKFYNKTLDWLDWEPNSNLPHARAALCWFDHRDTRRLGDGIWLRYQPAYWGGWEGDKQIQRSNGAMGRWYKCNSLNKHMELCSLDNSCVWVSYTRQHVEQAGSLIQTQTKYNNTQFHNTITAIAVFIYEFSFFLLFTLLHKGLLYRFSLTFEFCFFCLC